jgi:hypothetical protein
MDEEDPEKRIAELERQLAEPRRIAEPTSVPVHRCFVATGPQINMKSMALLFVYGGTAVMVGLPFALSGAFHLASGSVAEWMHWLVLGGYGVVGIALARSGRMRSYFEPSVSIRVTGDGLEITRGRGRGEVFPMIGATLGRWATADFLLGTALHLRNGRHRFVLGGQSYVPAGARLDAKPMWNVDAWLPAPDFGDLLALFYR